MWVVQTDETLKGIRAVVQMCRKNLTSSVVMCVLFVRMCVWGGYLSLSLSLCVCVCVRVCCVRVCCVCVCVCVRVCVYGNVVQVSKSLCLVVRRRIGSSLTTLRFSMATARHMLWTR